MNPITLNLVAIGIFSITMLSLVGPLIQLSPAVPAIATATILVGFTLDRFGWNGRGGTLLVSGLARLSPDYRQRVLHHEAGHFLVAYLLDLPIAAYALSPWDAWRQQLPGAGGVVVDSLNDLPQAPVELTQRVNHYCQLWMAGIAAEELLYDSSQGGEDDRLQLRQFWQKLDQPASEGQLKERWALLQARTLIEAQRPAYDALVAAMAERLPVAACCQAIDQHRQLNSASSTAGSVTT